ncbi:hypothetical protein QTP86_021899 [Hemibagrus guttatus]|nr:hypothetical protein QTP86_021899 [Hemibagrus guttatus]
MGKRKDLSEFDKRPNFTIMFFDRLHTGWSVHTFQTERQRKTQVLSKRELDIILSVIHRAEQLDLIEQHRIGRLMERLENMRRSAVGNGLSQCLLCGEALGLLGTPSVLCFDCCKKVCTKCGIETACSQKRAQWLCKICSEQREIWECQLLQNMWKRSGAWFYKFLPKYIHPEKDSFMNQRPVMEREEQPVARSVPITYTWAHRKVDSSESDGSDSELSDASSDRKTFIPESIKRRHSALSESSGNIGLTPLQSILSSPSRASFLSESHSSLGSERGSLVPAPEDEDTEQGRTSLCLSYSKQDFQVHIKTSPTELGYYGPCIAQQAVVMAPRSPVPSTEVLLEPALPSLQPIKQISDYFPRYPRGFPPTAAPVLRRAGSLRSSSSSSSSAQAAASSAGEMGRDKNGDGDGDGDDDLDRAFSTASASSSASASASALPPPSRKEEEPDMEGYDSDDSTKDLARPTDIVEHPISGALWKPRPRVCGHVTIRPICAVGITSTRCEELWLSH